MLFDTRPINERYLDLIVDLDTDKFYIELTYDQKRFFLDTLQYFTRDAASNKYYVAHGNIQYCPGCKKMRVTSCVACGCGECYTCGYRYCCNSGNVEDIKSWQGKYDEILRYQSP